MNLEEITKEIELMKQVQKSKLDLYDRQIGEIMDAKAKFLNESKQELDAALELQKQLLGDAESIETDSFIVSKKYPNLKSKRKKSDLIDT